MEVTRFPCWQYTGIEQLNLPTQAMKLVLYANFRDEEVEAYTSLIALLINEKLGRHYTSCLEMTSQPVLKTVAMLSTSGVLHTYLGAGSGAAHMYSHVSSSRTPARGLLLLHFQLTLFPQSPRLSVPPWETSLSTLLPGNYFSMSRPFQWYVIWKYLFGFKSFWPVFNS